MSETETPSPWLGGPGARWAQIALFVLHLAFLLALAVCAWSFWRLLPRVQLEPWQKGLFFAAILVSFVVFGARALRIGRDLWRARGELQRGKIGPD